MSEIILNGGNLLEGEVHISGSKNSALAIISASLLCRDKVKLFNCPDIEDVTHMFRILKSLGVEVTREGDYVEIDSTSLRNIPIKSPYVSKLRASYYLMGVYTALFQRVVIDMPGGCDLGSRPINLHLKAFKRLNCLNEIEDDVVTISTSQMKAEKIFLEIPSVGATVNIMLASVFTNGTTTIDNAAKEPEIIDLANFLNKMGANITGTGSCCIKIEGVKKLHKVEHDIIYDRIEAGTYALIAAGSGKEVDIINFNHKYNSGLISKLIESNIKFRLYENKIKILKSDDIFALNIKTSYFPGFPTDLQQIYLALLTKAKGVSTIHDQIYPNRFKNCYELNKMGAKIIVKDLTATVYGPNKIKGTVVKATDLRAGASLILAGLMAEGETTIQHPEHIFRGYSDIIEKIRRINGEIRIV